MTRILVAGGDGTLGSQIVAELHSLQQQVRVLSRNPAPAHLPAATEWAQADVLTGAGLQPALQDVHTLVNCITSPVRNTYEVDVAGTRRMLAQARQSGVQYVVQLSIIGIDRILNPYYQYKLGTELAVVESGIPYLIARSAQFHSFVDFLLSPLREVAAQDVHIPIDVQFQSVSAGDVAAYLAPFIINTGPVGRLPDIGGPQVLSLGQMAQAWLAAQGLTHSIQPDTEARNDLPAFEAFGEGFVKGYNTNPDNPLPGMTWTEYLLSKYRTDGSDLAANDND